MSEHPILFTSEMVRAILDGRKTQTRRIIKQIPSYYRVGKRPQGYDDNELAFLDMADPIGTYPTYTKCPYGKVGDTLWVRESFAIFDVDGDEDIAIGYKADDTYKTVEWFKDKRKCFKKLKLGHWRPSIHLHRWAARIFLEITNIKVERVQDISWLDCKAEGVQICFGIDYSDADKKFSAQRIFKPLWDSINAKRYETIHHADGTTERRLLNYGWDKNPWVWVVTFNSVPKR